jgi:hypothetical protein
VIENYKYHILDDDKGIKTIVRPIFVHTMLVHNAWMLGRSVNENNEVVMPYFWRKCPANKIRINHYQTKSWQDWDNKNIRGDVLFSNEKKFTKEEFDMLDKKEVYDTIMDKYIAQVKERLLSKNN